MSAAAEQRRPGSLAALLLVGCLAAAITGFAYWPGLMSWDPVHQYGEAVSGEITDWHPPAMQWVWQWFMRLTPGPAPMLLLQLGLWWGGLLLLAGTILRGGRPRLAWGLLACGLLPLSLALTGQILKDCLMGGALMMSVGLLAVAHRRARHASAMIAAALLLFAATLRFNAFAACLPLFLALLPPATRATLPRLLATGLGVIALLMAAMPIANRLIGAQPSGVTLSLIIFDLGGITEHSGTSVFPTQLGVTDPVAANHACYRPHKWDSYSNWVDPECPLGFTAWRQRVEPAGVSATSLWLKAVSAHPLAYAAHRLTHFAYNTRLLPLADSIERPVQFESAPNDWGFHVTPNPWLHALDTFAVASAHTPLGWPIVWIGLALGALIAGWRAPTAWLIVPLATSSFLYGLGYLPFSVAAELRYHLWTGVAALLATAIVLADCPHIPRRRLLLGLMPPVIAILAALAFRL